MDLKVVQPSSPKKPHKENRESVKKRPHKPKGGRVRLNAIHQEVRDRICLLRYPPGMVLRETELATEFGVSRTPVRQILQRLEFEGLAQTTDGVGTIVTGVDFKAFKHAYELRLKIAELIGELSPAPYTDADIAVIEGLRHRAERLREKKNLEEYWQINHDLQDQISRHIGNEALRWIHDLFYYQTARVWYHVLSDMWDRQVESLCAELTDLIRVMRTGDLRGVGFVRRNYIAEGRNRMSRYLNDQA